MLLDASHVVDAYMHPKLHGSPAWQPRNLARKGLVFLQRSSDDKVAGRNGAKTAAPALGAFDFVSLMVAVRDTQDRAAYAQIFQNFAPRVKAFLMKSGSDAALAEELAQDVLTTVWQKSAQFDPARASLSTWIFTIARNRRIDYFRRARRPEPEDLDWGPQDEPDAADIFEVAEETRRLGAALAVLPAPQRALIERAYYGDLSHSEIAAQTGLPLGTIKSRIRLALERLRQNMN